MKKENIHQISRQNLEILFLTFKTEKKYEIWIFFETNELKKLTLFFLRNKKQFVNIFSNIEGGKSHEAS